MNNLIRPIIFIIDLKHKSVEIESKANDEDFIPFRNLSEAHLCTNNIEKEDVLESVKFGAT